MNVQEYYENMNYCPACKKAKALEIIKKCCLLGVYPCGIYELAFTTKIDITKEEYDLLKEILL